MNQEEYINIETESIDRTGEFEVEQAPELPNLPPSRPLPTLKPIVYDSPEPKERSFAWLWILIALMILVAAGISTYLIISKSTPEPQPVIPVINQTQIDLEQAAIQKIELERIKIEEEIQKKKIIAEVEAKWKEALEISNKSIIVNNVTT